MGSTHCITMTLFRNPQIKRLFASAMLVFWVFALGVGWANACLLQDRTTHLEASTVATVEAPAVSSGHVGGLTSHAQDPTPGQSPCLKVCDDGSQSPVKWQSGIELPDMAMLPPFAMPWSASVAALDAPQSVRLERQARAEMPLRTRYVRLAL